MVNWVQSARALAVALFVVVATLCFGAWSPLARASTAPTLELASTPPASTVSDTILIAGAAHGHGEGISDVTITSDQLGLTFSADVDGGGNFSLSLPLELGDNQIQITPVNGSGVSGLPTAFAIERSLPATPLLTIDEPNVNYQQTLDTSIDVSGRVFTTLPIEDIVVRMGETLAVPTQGEDAYEYVFHDVTLGDGLNQLEVTVYSQYGSVNEAVSVDVVSSLNPDEMGPPPTIELAVASDTVVVHDSIFVLAGVVQTDCLGSLLVDGLAPDETLDTGSGAHSFSAEIVLDENTSYEVAVTAEACDGAESGVSVVFERDDTPPVVVFTTPAPSPEILVVNSNPVHVTGYVDEPNLVGAMFSGFPLELEPSLEDGRWVFDVTVKLDRGQDTGLEVIAWNSAGQSGSAVIGVRLEQSVDLELLSPQTGDSFTLADGEMEIGAEARMRDAGSADSVWFQLDEEEAVLGGAGEGDHSALLGPLGGGETHTVTAWAQDVDGTVLAQSTASFSTIDLDSIPISIFSQTPGEGAENVETNQPLTLHFNRQIDPETVEIRVFETVSGFVYESPSDDTDLRNMSNVVRAEVEHEHEPVAGKAQNLPGDRIFSFSPTNPWTYGAQIDVELWVDDVHTASTNFNVRDFPSLVHGFTLDDYFQPMAGVAVSLPDLGHETVSDANGEFGFGWGWPADKTLEPGRHRVVFNAGGKDPRLAMVEGWIDVVAGENRGGLSFVVPSIPTSARFASLSGEQLHVMENGLLSLDLEEAVLSFPDGGSSGVVAPHLTDVASTGYPGSMMELPLFAVRMDPGGVTVSGDVSIEVRLPKRQGTYDYLASLVNAEGRNPVGILYALDPDTLVLSPAGVFEFDPTTMKAVMPRKSDHVQRLDVLAFGIAPIHAIPTALQYLDGDADFDAVIASLVVTP